MNSKMFILENHFEGLPKPTDFKIVEEKLTALKNGEILTEALYISVDPYVRAYSDQMNIGDIISAFQVAKVLESKHEDYKVNDIIVGSLGWQTLSITAPDQQGKEESVAVKPYKLSDLGDLPPSLGLGLLGIPGCTAYFGLLELCDPKPGQVLVVTGAAGAVGSHVAQIAKHKGCIVIGITGNDEKVKYLQNELKLDAAFNYKKGDLATSLASMAPKGIDCYFDNVGGEISSIVMYQMKHGGKVAVCGSISSYNADMRNLPKAPILQPAINQKELLVQGFIVLRWIHRWEEAVKQNLAWIKEGWLKYPEKVFHGFDALPECFIDMLQGGNIGKAFVKV